MKKLMTLIAVAFAVVAACANTKPENGREGVQEPSSVEYDIFLVIGQSNAAGRGIMLEEDSKPIEGVKIVCSQADGSVGLVDACQPLNQHSTVRKGIKMQKFNFAGPFAARIHKKTGRPVLLIVNARGGTSLYSWLPSASQLTYSREYGDEKSRWGQQIPQLYGDAVRIVRQVLEQEDIKGELKAVLWHQGCGNSNAAESSKYCSNLKQVVDGLRKEFDKPELPFVAGQLLPEYKNAQYFNPEIVKIGEVIENAYCVTSEDCVSVGDGTHFDRTSLIMMGERYADIILEVVYGK